MSIDERGPKHDVKATGGDVWLYPRAPLTGVIDIYPGALIAHRLGSKLAEMPDPSNPRSDLVFLGQATNTVHCTSATWATDTLVAANADGEPYKVQVEGDNWLIRGFETGTGANALTANDIDRIVYAYDNNTLYKTDNGGTLSPAGTLACVDTVTGLCTLDLRGPKAAVVVAATGAAQETARAVVTSLAANTVTAGVMTADAAGAFATQDGVSTLVAGDTIIIPAGTTNLDAAADAGPWEIQTLGSVSAAFVLRRPSWWAHGSPIKQSAEVKVSGEGALYQTPWRSFVAPGKVVGADDPALYPEQVTQSVSLGGGSPVGHVAITNVPIRSATKTNYIIRRVTAVTSTLTLEYVPLSITPGPLGTATVDITAAIAAGTINAADGSTLLVSIVNF